MVYARPARFAFALATAVALGAAPASAQVFGKNKVQYEPLEWHVLETPHLRLHFYAQEESLARRLAAMAESVCVEFDTRFRLTPRRPIPFLLYSAHHVFQQTNATPGLISEGTGGLTELIKGRVLVPHTGSWARLVWVTRHELAHAYMLEKLGQVMKTNRRTQGYLPPLWFIEGLAEYCGTQWDPEAEGLLRDAVVSGKARPLTRSESITGSVLMYKEGHSFLLYLAERFGREKVFDLLDNWHRADDFETVFRITFGEPLSEVDEAWFAELRRRYYPVVAWAASPGEVAERLTGRGDFNLGPRVLPLNGAGAADTALRFCYFAASEAGVDLMLSQPGRDGRRREHRLLRGGHSPAFESFHLFQSRPDASPSGLIALSSKRGGRDALYLVDSRRRRVVKRLEFPHLVAINDPAIVPGDQALVFSAQDQGGRGDLYRASWSGEEEVLLERLTDDDPDDLEPDVSPDGRWIVFASDRGGADGRYRLFRLPAAGGSPEPLSAPPEGDDRQPVYSPDGHWIAFRSTRGGTSDLWVRPAEPAREVRRVTRLIGPASDPDWTADGRGLLFTAQERVAFQTYHLTFDPDTLASEIEPAPDPEPRSLAAAAVHAGPRRPYQRRLSLDLVQNGVAFDPQFGAGAGGQIALSDVLGNEQFHIFLANDSERFGNFWDGFEGGITYVNQSQRLNYGVGFFRLTQVYDVELDVVRREKRLGLVGLASYPFNKFTRLEGTVLVRHATDHRLADGRVVAMNLVSNFLALVKDNSRWTAMGPSGGTRMYLGGGFTRDLAAGLGNNASLLAEIRHYRTPVASVVLASRIQAQASLWRDAQRFYLGGYNSLPGVSRRTLSGHQTLLVQEELRFPLVRRLVVAIPSPWEFPTVSGTAFAGAAWAWEDAFGRRWDDRVGIVGVGLYLGGGYYPAIRWNFVWSTRDFRTFGPRPRTQFTLGFNY